MRQLVDGCCNRCGSTFRVRSAEVKRGRGKYCSHSCAAAQSANGRRPQTGAANPNWKGSISSQEKGRRYRGRYPDKAAAHQAVTNALRREELKTQPCEVCGEEDSQAHHDDYSKPLDVRWFCKKHHLLKHRVGIKPDPPVF